MKRPADPFGVVVLAVIGLAALVVSARYLALLAQLLGWVPWTSWLLPVAVDLLAAYAVRCWLASGRPVAVRQYARKVAVAMLATSILGNAAAHVLLAWPGLLGDVARIVLTVGVGAVPPVALFVAVHLYAIGASPLPTRNRVEKSPLVVEGSGQARLEASPELPSEPAVPLHAVNSVHDVDLVAKARDLDAAHQARHGRGISIEALRKELGVRKARAAEIRELARQAA